MKFLYYGHTLVLTTFFFLISSHSAVGSQQVHVWEKVEITLNANNNYNNAYTDVNVWVQLTGPNFNKKVWGFWDGDAVFKVRICATGPGEWSWESFASETDNGLVGKTGSFTAIAWTEAEKQENPNRRGFIRTSSTKGHTYEYADGTPFFFLADTWYAATTWRYPIKNATIPADYVPEESNWSFEGGIQWLRRHGFNGISMIACYPNWIDDGRAPVLTDNNGITLRDAEAWKKAGTNTVKDMHDEDENRPFMTPGTCAGLVNTCADFDRINPAYFKNLDKKFEYLGNNGFLPQMETIRRDHFASWMEYHEFPESFSRYINYLKARYGVYNMILSLVHWDWTAQITGSQLKAAFEDYHATYGGMPFGQPVTAMMYGSTLDHLGHVDEVPYITCHVAGNWARDHRIYGKITEFFNESPAAPAYNNEPYYPHHDVEWGRVHGERVEPNSDRDNYFARAQMYGNFLSGALGGHIYGSGAFGGDTEGEPEHDQWPYIWEALQFPSLLQMEHFRAFVLSEGDIYQDLLLANDDLSPRKSPGSFEDGLDGWAYMMRNTDKNHVFLYFENETVKQTLADLLPDTDYRAQWFDPLNGEWSQMSDGSLTTDSQGSITMPDYPDGQSTSDRDWAAKLVNAAVTNKNNQRERKISSSFLTVTPSTVGFSPVKGSIATLDLITVNGRVVKRLFQGKAVEEKYAIAIASLGLSQGIYVVRLQQGRMVNYKQLVIVSFW